MPLVARCGSSFLRTVTFLIIHRFLPLKFPLSYICFSKSTAYNTFQFKKMFWIWWKVLDTIILWQDVGSCCGQTHAAFEVGLTLDHGQGVYSGWSDVVVSSQLRLCHTCIIDVMITSYSHGVTQTHHTSPPNRKIVNCGDNFYTGWWHIICTSNSTTSYCFVIQTYKQHQNEPVN